MRRPATLAPPFALALTLAAVPLLAAGGQPTPTPESPQTDAELALEAYNSGLEHRDKAWELEEEAAAAAGGERAKLEKKAEKQYRKAIDDFRAAVEKDPGLHQAWSSLGYALRKTGEYDASLDAYDRALELEPEYAEAIEYRGETFLGLGRLDDARDAYMELFNQDREKADELLAAMEEWVEENAAGGDGGEGIEEFAAWVEERRQIADQTAHLVGAGGGARSW